MAALLKLRAKHKYRHTENLTVSTCVSKVCGIIIPRALLSLCKSAVILSFVSGDPDLAYLLLHCKVHK